MKRLLRFYDSAVAWLMHFGSDKYLHFIVGLLIAFFAAHILYCLVSYHLLSALFGIVLAMLIGIFKEELDEKRGGKFDIYDALFTSLGGVLGAILSVM